MAGNIHRYLADDHRCLDDLLDRALADPEHIDAAAYVRFRAGLLKHIGMEDKVLLPAAQKQRDGAALPVAARLRLDHGALAALLVPPPTGRVVAAIRGILKLHNPIEEDQGGLYDQCEELVGSDADEVFTRLQKFPEVKVLPHVDSDFVMEAARRALARAGYEFEL